MGGYIVMIEDKSKPNALPVTKFAKDEVEAKLMVATAKSMGLTAIMKAQNASPFSNVKKGDYVIRQNTHSGSIGVVEGVSGDGTIADVKWNQGTGRSSIAVKELKVVNEAYANGRVKAATYLNSRAEAVGVRVENSLAHA